MTPDEVGVLLAKCAAYDRRTTGRADIAAWHEVVADLGLTDALGAVATWYTDNREFVMPSDIRRLVRAERAARIVATVEPLPDADPDDVAAYRAALRAGRARIASGNSPRRPVAQLLDGAFRDPS